MEMDIHDVRVMGRMSNFGFVHPDGGDENGGQRNVVTE